MTIISLYYFGGYLPCSSQKFYSRGTGVPRPYARINEKNADFRSEALEEVRDSFEKRVRTPDFWKNRLIIHFALSPLLHSVTFVPFDVGTPQVWYVAKNGDEHQSLVAFFAPDLSDENQAALGCINASDQLSIINNQSDFLESISTIQHNALLDTAFLLKYFFQDQLTKSIGFTYHTQGGQLVYRYWNKGPALNYELNLKEDINELISQLR